MIAFADTSALFALLVRNDYMYERARMIFEQCMRDEVQLLTSSYVLVETMALLQRRVGMNAVMDFHDKIVPLLDIIWVDGEWHTKAMNRLFILQKREVSLVDCLSFVIMEMRDIQYAYSFDGHFTDYGFTLLNVP